MYEFIVLWSVFINYVYMYVADNSHWMHLYAGLLLHCQDSIVDESRGSKAKSQQREFDGRDSLMVRRLIEVVSIQTQATSTSNNPIVESQMVRQVFYLCVSAGRF